MNWIKGLGEFGGGVAEGLTPYWEWKARQQERAEDREHRALLRREERAESQLDALEEAMVSIGGQNAINSIINPPTQPPIATTLDEISRPEHWQAAKNAGAAREEWEGKVTEFGLLPDQAGTLREIALRAYERANVVPPDGRIDARKAIELLKAQAVRDAETGAPSDAKAEIRVIGSIVKGAQDVVNRQRERELDHALWKKRLGAEREVDQALWEKRQRIGSKESDRLAKQKHSLAKDMATFMSDLNLKDYAARLAKDEELKGNHFKASVKRATDMQRAMNKVAVEQQRAMGAVSLELAEEEIKRLSPLQLAAETDKMIALFPHKMRQAKEMANMLADVDINKQDKLRGVLRRHLVGDMKAQASARLEMAEIVGRAKAAELTASWPQRLREIKDTEEVSARTQRQAQMWRDTGTLARAHGLANGKKKDLKSIIPNWENLSRDDKDALRAKYATGANETKAVIQGEERRISANKQEDINKALSTYWQLMGRLSPDGKLPEDMDEKFSTDFMIGATSTRLEETSASRALTQTIKRNAALTAAKDKDAFNRVSSLLSAAAKKYAPDIPAAVRDWGELNQEERTALVEKVRSNPEWAVKFGNYLQLRQKANNLPVPSGIAAGVFEAIDHNTDAGDIDFHTNAVKNYIESIHLSRVRDLEGMDESDRNEQINNLLTDEDTMPAGTALAAYFAAGAAKDAAAKGEAMEEYKELVDSEMEALEGSIDQGARGGVDQARINEMSKDLAWYQGLKEKGGLYDTSYVITTRFIPASDGTSIPVVDVVLAPGYKPTMAILEQIAGDIKNRQNLLRSKLGQPSSFGLGDGNRTPGGVGITPVPGTSPAPVLRRP